MNKGICRAERHRLRYEDCPAGSSLFAGWRILKLAVGFESIPSFDLNVLLSGIRAGVNEEMAFRGLAVALLLRKFRKPGQIWIPAVFTGVFFGATHLLNMFSGDPVLNTLVNTFFAASVGVLLGVLFTLSGNIWPVMVIHSLYDVLAFCCADIARPDAMVFAEIGIFIVIMGIYLYVLHRNRDRAASLWNEKWSKTAA